MSTENSLQLYLGNMPEAQARELQLQRQRLTAVESHKRFGHLVRLRQLDELIGLMLPEEVTAMTLTSSLIFKDELPVFGAESFWHRIPTQDANDRIEAYHVWLTEQGKTTHAHDKPKLPPTMHDSGLGYMEVRDPVKITGHLSSVLRAIMESDRDDEWKLTCLFELGEVMIAGAIRLNDQMTTMATSIFDLLNSVIDSAIGENLGVAYRDRVLTYLYRMIDGESTDDPSLPLDDEEVAQLKAVNYCQRFAEQIRYLLSCSMTELEDHLSDHYLEHAAEISADEAEMDLIAEDMEAGAAMENAFTFDVSDEDLAAADAEDGALEVTQQAEKGE